MVRFRFLLHEIIAAQQQTPVEDLPWVQTAVSVAVFETSTSPEFVAGLVV